MNSDDYYQESFEQMYRCYPISSINRQHLENGDKILMPQSALDRLASLRIDYPMLFQIYNPSANRSSHCGVLEFSAEEGAVYLPCWMMQNLLLQEGDIVQMKNANLVKGSFVKLQPHTTEFLDISDPKATLERTLRMFSCLTTGDTIMIDDNKKKHYINIIETKPSSAISIIETDCEVDFIAPLDYKEPSIVPRKVSSQVKEDPQKTEEPKFFPFTGQARRLDGKPLQEDAAAGNRSAHGIGTTSTTRLPGKLVFGSSSSKAPNEQPPNQESKFKPFIGRKYSLLD